MQQDPDPKLNVVLVYDRKLIPFLDVTLDNKNVDPQGNENLDDIFRVS